MSRSRHFVAAALLVQLSVLVGGCVADETKPGNDVQIAPQIIQGRIAKPGKFPFVVSFFATTFETVGVSETFYCQGALVSERRVLTTGTCGLELLGYAAATAGNLVVARAGNVAVNNKTDFYIVTAGAVLRSFEASVNAGVVNTTDNLVLAQLDRNMEDITPVKLAPKDAKLQTGQRLHIVGFGSPYKSLDVSRRLRFISVRKSSERRCNKELRKRFGPGAPRSVDNALCTGDPNGVSAWNGQIQHVAGTIALWVCFELHFM